MFTKWKLCVLLLGFALVAMPARADEGFLGVYVAEGDEGMLITDFIRNTPAYKLHERGDLDRFDTIVKLAGKKVRTLSQLKNARDSIPYGKEGRMVMIDQNGDSFHVWIRPARVSARAMAPQYSFSPRHAGRGDGADIRDANDGPDRGSDPDPDIR